MNNSYKIIFAIAILFTSTLLMAQPSAPPATPIDGGLSLLLAAGALFGIKKIRDSKNQ